MSEKFDVVVVGARCAGSPLATLLAHEGMRVALVERAEFPCDTLSTHIFEAPGINLLGRLGLLDRVRATGAEPIRRLDFRQDEFAIEAARQTRLGLRSLLSELTHSAGRDNLCDPGRLTRRPAGWKIGVAERGRRKFTHG